MKIKTKTRQIIDCNDFDELVEKTYGKVYCFQQQDDCKGRGVEHFSVPCESYDEEMHDSIPEIINGEKMGVKFKTWLARDTKQPFANGRSDISIFWERNFYPDFGTLINDLHEKGLIDAGKYTIEIDW